MAIHKSILTGDKKLPFPIPSRFTKMAIGALVLFSLVYTSYYNIKKGSFARTIVVDAIGGKDRIASPILRVDAFYKELPGDGNIFLYFKGFDTTSSNQKAFVTTQYYRLTYKLYPRRVFVGKPDKIINNGIDILNTNFYPDEEWLERYNIRSTITFLRSSTDKIQYSIKRLP